MRATWKGVAVGLALAVGSGSAAAQGPPSANVYCQSGSSSACFAIGFGSSGSTLSLWLQNLQGSLAESTTPYSLDAIDVERRNATSMGAATENLFWFLLDGGTAEGDVAVGSGQFEEESYVEDFDPVTQLRAYRPSTASGVLGCSLFAAADYVARTCPAIGLDGWLRLDFFGQVWDVARDESGEFADYVNPRSATWSDVRVTVNGCRFTGAESGFQPTGTSGPCMVPNPNQTVVPEPGTFALLGGGLGLLGMMGWRRSRR